MQAWYLICSYVGGGGGYAGLVSLTSSSYPSPYSSELFVLGGGVDDKISTSPRGLGILYKALLARKLSKPEDGRYRPKHVVFSIANKHHHLAIYL